MSNCHATDRRKPDLNRDPRRPEVLAWLASLDPYEELTVRLALRGRHEDLSSDPAFSDRVKALLSLLDPTPQETAAIVRRARALENELNEPPARDAAPAKAARKPRRS